LSDIGELFCTKAQEFYLRRDDFIVLYSTELIDRNGVEIFEGDVVFNIFAGRYYSVEYGAYDEVVGWVLRDIHERAYKEIINKVSGNFLEIVGNCYVEFPLPPASFEV